MRKRKERVLKVRIDDDTLILLRELTSIMGSPSLSETIRSLIIGFHVMVKSGVWKVLKPIPELSELILKESGKERAGA